MTRLYTQHSGITTLPAPSLDGCAPALVERLGADRVLRIVSGHPGSPDMRGRYERAHADGTKDALVGPCRRHAAYARKGYRLVEVIDL
jgi:hypothetical protein